jgi:hypothetical protein
MVFVNLGQTKLVGVVGSNPFLADCFILGKEKGDMWPRARDRATQYHDGYRTLSSAAPTVLTLFSILRKLLVSSSSYSQHLESSSGHALDRYLGTSRFLPGRPTVPVPLCATSLRSHEYEGGPITAVYPQINPPVCPEHHLHPTKTRQAPTIKKLKRQNQNRRTDTNHKISGRN